MIVPLIKVQSENDWTETLLGQIKHWSLFGATCLQIDFALDEAPLKSLQRVVKQTGGQTDIFIQSDDLSDEQALELLNIGGSGIVTSTGNREHFASIPDDRLSFVDSDQWNVLAAPSAETIAD